MTKYTFWDKFYDDFYHFRYQVGCGILESIYRSFKYEMLKRE